MKIKRIRVFKIKSGKVILKGLVFWKKLHAVAFKGHFSEILTY